MKITIGQLKQLIKETYDKPSPDEELLMSKGWYPVDNRLMIWVNPEHEDGKEVGRREAITIVRGKPNDNYPGIT